MSESIIKIERVFAFSREVVFDAWTSPEALKQWHCGTILECVMELNAGGTFQVQFEQENDSECEHLLVRGKYLEVNRPERLQYTWKWDGSEMEDSLVTIDFQSKGPQSTLMRLTHAQLSPQKSRDDHAEGWKSCLDGLNEYLT